MKPNTFLVISFGLVLPTNAFGMPGFPGQIQQYLNLSYTPSCSICHASAQGGGPVTQPFGQAMLAAGLTTAGGTTLTAALDKLTADGTDSNGDGISDIQSLKQGLDPNSVTSKPPVEYDCGGARIASRGQLGFPAAIATLFSVLLLSWRKSRRVK